LFRVEDTLEEIDVLHQCPLNRLNNITFSAINKDQNWQPDGSLAESESPPS
jgi:hypothetical protein